MKKLQTVSHYSDEELKAIMYSQTEIRAFWDWQIIYSVQTNSEKKAEEIAGILGVRKSKVLRVIQLYNKKGVCWRTYGQCGGRREKRCHLSIGEESILLKSIESDALPGKVLSYR